MTEKDAAFLERLKVLMQKKDLYIELKENGLKRLVLKKNYGSKIESAFGLTRQGIHWRFKRLFNEIYLNAYLTIYWVESNFGTELRQKAMAIAKEQIELHRKAKKAGRFHTPKERH